MDQIGSILSGLGVTWMKFIAQIIIFLSVYLILAKFAFPPIMKILEERRRRIEEGEENLKRIKKQLAESDAAVQAKLDDANERATRLIAEAKEGASALSEREKQQAAQDAADIIAKARVAAVADRDQLMSELKKDFGRLVTDATRKVTGKVLTTEDQERINQETSTQLVS